MLVDQRRQKNKSDPINVEKPDWIIGGRIKGGYSIGAAPASHNNPTNVGGSAEIIPYDPNNVILDWFYMTD